MSDLIDSKKEDTEFVKQVPLHTRERLKRKKKLNLILTANQIKKVKTILLLQNRSLSIQEMD